VQIEYFDPEPASYSKQNHSESCAYKLHYHVVLATKYRRPVLVDGVGEALKDIIVRTCDAQGYHLLGAVVQPEHVHLILSLKPNDAPGDVVAKLKGASSYALVGKFPELKEKLGTSKLWGGGYSVDTLGRANAFQVKAYLDKQKRHHQDD